MTERENALAAFEHKRPQWVPAINVACALIPVPEINDRPVIQDGVDWFGVKWEMGADAGVMTHVAPGQKKIITNISEWRKQVLFPSCKDLPWQAMAARTNTVWAERDQRLGYVISAIGAFERINILMGHEDGLCAMYDDTAAYIDFVNAYADYRIVSGKYCNP